MSGIELDRRNLERINSKQKNPHGFRCRLMALSDKDSQGYFDMQRLNTDGEEDDSQDGGEGGMSLA